jgi:pimeloyl-ACP methyl ester carboxylesterase
MQPIDTVRSADGTPIAFTRTVGRVLSDPPRPALIIVDGALCSRAFGPSTALAERLARHFTVYTYDRRGRGASGNTLPYSPAREIEDIAALIAHAGGSASLLGLSSGGALALEAAAAGLPIDKVVAYEPPYVEEAGSGGASQRGGGHESHLARLIADGDRGGAVKYFMRDMVGAPAFVPIMLRLMPWIWTKLQAVAHTLPNDAAVMSGFTIPRARFAAIAVPAIVMHGSKTDARLKHAAEETARIIPGASHRVLAGQTHNVKTDVLVPAVIEFLAPSGAAAAA